jgi:PTH1 family peptidyl-tRNA hydrolase
MREGFNGQASQPILIAGLGNPGREYKYNRHNVGFMVLDRLAALVGETFRRRQMESLVTEANLEGRRVMLAKPQTYVNRAGQALGPLMRFYRLPLTNLLVIVDDLDLPQGMIRLRASGGSGGHNGLRSIESNLNSQDFARLRIGIGRPPGRMDPADYVLQDFRDEELEFMYDTFDRTIDCVRTFLSAGIEAAMTDCNANADD